MKVSESIKPETINSGWKKLCQELLKERSTYDCTACSTELVKGMMEEIVQLSKAIGGEGFQDTSSQDITEVINPKVEELTEENLVEMNAVETVTDD